MATKKTRSQTSKKPTQLGLIILALTAFLLSILAYFIFLSQSTKFNTEKLTIFIPSEKANKNYVYSILKENVHTIHLNVFLIMADGVGYWDKVKPGKYTIEKGSSLFKVFRKLYSGKQSPVKLVLTKFRTKKDLSQYVGNKLECTSNEIFRFISSEDSLKSLGMTEAQFLSIIIPNTYEFFWNTSSRGFVERMQKESTIFWNKTRIENAARLGLSKTEVSIIASIVEEETNDIREKPLIASVYINRLKKNMPLGADPTVKFAVGDFSIRRLTFKHINATAESPYNTYKNKGLPPGPICTPSISSIDAVLKGVNTEYLFFCAKADFSGSHSFAVTAEEHIQNAQKYQKALDSLKIH